MDSRGGDHLGVESRGERKKAGNRDREGRTDSITKQVQPFPPQFLLRALQTRRQKCLRDTCVAQPFNSRTEAQAPPDRAPLDPGIQAPIPSSLRLRGPAGPSPLPSPQLLPHSEPGAGAPSPSPSLWRYHGNQAPCPPSPATHIESHFCWSLACV